MYTVLKLESKSDVKPSKRQVKEQFKAIYAS